MTDQEPAEEERKKARSPDDGLGAAGGGGGRSSLALPGASSAPSSPSHSSPSWTRAKENEQQFEEDSHVGVAEERRRPSPHAHLVDPPIPSDCSAENDSEWECEKPVDSHPGPVSVAPFRGFPYMASSAQVRFCSVSGSFFAWSFQSCRAKLHS
jgi:hypothetical protein